MWVRTQINRRIASDHHTQEHNLLVQLDHTRRDMIETDRVSLCLLPLIDHSLL
uniref:Uncharacterized protein n=1 Tax=Oryza brachyantha TaxID=4533 RepID=J3M9C8_ORYBR